MFFKKKKEIVLASETGRNPEEYEENQYYIDISNRFGVMKYLMLIFLALYLVIMLLLYRSFITYDNLTYILRDISSDATDIDADFPDVSYDLQNNMDFAVFKGELAVVGTSKITLYNSAATKTFTYPVSMENPTFISSDKYLLCYDLGGTSYSLFTNLTRVLDSSEEGIIENASIANDGSYLLVSRAKESKYTVSVYSSSFDREARYYKSRFVTDAQISPNGKTIAICSVDISGAFFDTKIELYERNGENPIKEISLQKVYPIKIEYFDDGSFDVICDSSVFFFDSKGNMLTQYNIAENSMSAFHQSGKSLVISVEKSSVGTDCDLILFDNTGNVLYNVSVPYRVNGISHNENNIFTLSNEKVTKFASTYGDSKVSDAQTKEVSCDIDTKYILEAGDYAIIGNDKKSQCVFGEKSN